jgi:hypothetical protein
MAELNLGIENTERCGSTEGSNDKKRWKYKWNKKCSIYGCHTDRREGSLHGIPKKKEIRKLWLQKLKLPMEYSSDLLICHKHSKTSDFSSKL